MKAQRILIVDDDEIDQYYTKRIIKKKAPTAEIVAAFDGGEALKLLSAEDFDVILLDVNMPGQNGFDFLGSFTRFNRQKWPAIFMLSSSTYAKDKETAAQYDIVKGFLEKPLEPDAFGLIEAATVQ